MAITTYTELQTAVANWLNRTDLVARIPEFIDLAEKRLQRRQRWFQEVYSIATGSLFTVTANPMQLPNFMRRLLNVINASNNQFSPLIIVSPAQMAQLREKNGNAPAGIPAYASVQVVSANTPQIQLGLSGALTIDLTQITIDQTTITVPNESALGPLYLSLWPAPATGFQIDLEYIRKLPPLSLYNTNALLVDHPDIYLYAALLESAPFLQHDERIAMWNDEFEKRVREVDTERDNTKFGATPRRPRLPVVFG